MKTESFVTCPKCRSTVTTLWGKCPKCDTVLPGFDPPPPPEPKIPDDPAVRKAKAICASIAEEYIEVKEEQKDIRGSEIAAMLKKTPSAFPRLKLNHEQSCALAEEAQFCLISARAGSGKTRTVVSKMLYLLDHEGLAPYEVLALSFNKGVRTEINERANKRIRSAGNQYAIRDLDFARTFHSLAYHAETNNRILKDEDKKKLVRDLLNCMKMNPLFKHKVYRHFRDESFKLSRLQFRDEKSYYQFLRNQTLHTLGGEMVKSQGEKWIADFLFEHGVRYDYEKRFFSSYITPNSLKGTEADKGKIIDFLDRNYRLDAKGSKKREDTIPDFYLPDYRLVLEHWGIDEYEDSQAAKEQFYQKFGTTWLDYKKKMDWKRKFWNSNLRQFINPAGFSLQNIADIKKMLETSVVDSSKGRTAFEAHLQELLTANGVKLDKVDQEELEEKVWSRQYPRFVSMMLSFIDKFEQRFPDGDVEKVRELLKTKNLDERQRDFIEIGLSVVERYYDITKRHRYPLLLPDKERYKEIDCDYNQLMADAARSILRGDSDALVCGLKVLLIDEYQDFSQLFHEFIGAILERNPNLQVFCVGDPWQAINRFMGADIRYFEGFKQYFPDGKELNISTNYRSGKRIVSTSNAFMKAQGFQGVPALAASTFEGRIDINDVRNVFLAMTPTYDPEGRDRQIRDLFTGQGMPDPLISLYVKRIIEILERDCKVDESVLILSRIGKIRRVYELKEVERKLKDLLLHSYGYSEERLKKIAFSTIHAAKGEEADVVILLEANSGRMPLLHPDHDLYQIFDETAQTVLDDEARLFYVAITRARKSLFILHDDNPSSYLKTLRRT